MEKHLGQTGIRCGLLVILVMLALVVFAGCDSDDTTGTTGAGSISPTISETSAPAKTSAVAQGAITVIGSDVAIDFPESLRFSLEAESTSEINDIELRYRIDKVTSVSVIATVTPEFSSGLNVQAHWDWDTRKASLPPGAIIEYYWVIDSDSGKRLQTQAATVVFDDLRYDWEEITDGMIRLFWYKGDDEFGQALMEAGQTALVRLAEDTGAQVENIVRIYIYANSDDLQGALTYSQKWTGGVTFTEYGIIAIGVPPRGLDWGMRTVAHELTHVVVAQVTDNPYTDLPTWLNEGLAMYIEGDLTSSFATALSDAISTDTLLSVDTLSSSFSADSDLAHLSYAQSHSLVKYLVDNFGTDRMLRLLEVFRDGNTQDDALLAVYGFDGDGLEDRWRDSLGL